MKNETMRWLKTQLKRKVSITKGLLITFMITGCIFTYAKTNPTVDVRATDDTIIIEKVVKNSANSTNSGEHGNSGDDSDATIVAPYKPGVVDGEDLTREDKARLGTPSDNRTGGGDGLEAAEESTIKPAERDNTTGNVDVSMSRPNYSDSSSPVSIPVSSDNHNDNVRYTPRSARTRRATNDNQPTPSEPTYTADTTYLIRAKKYDILGGNLITVNEDASTTSENKVFKLDDSAISTALTNKADKNADNLSNEDVIKWKDKLGIRNIGSSTGPTNITITNYGEQTGLELGDNSRARGIGSVSTGRNGIAIGKNAVAIGENETKESIERKLEEDRQKIQEILNTKKEIAAKEWELRLKQIREKETIEAQRRVDETLKEKEKVKANLDSLNDILRNKEIELNNLKNQYVTNSNAIEDKLDFVLERMKEMEDSESGHNYTANLVKSKVEEGTQLNLSLDFYKELLQNYNSYLQNPRERDDRAILETTLSNYDTTHSSNLRNINFNYNTNDIIIPTDDNADNIDNSPTGGTSLYSFSKNSGNGHWWMSNITPYASTAYTSTASYNPSDNPTAYNRLGSYELGKYDDTSHNIHRRYLTSSDNNTYSLYTVGDKKINTYLSIDTDITTEQEFNDWNSVKDEWKERIKSYNAKLGDEVIGKLDTLTGGKSTILYNMVTDMKFELVDLDKQITYYQGKYNETKDASWLERKKQALDTRTNRIANNETKLKDKARELGYELDNTSNLNYVLGYKHWENWKNNNISEAAKKYNVLATRLKDELANALELDRYRGLKSNDNVDKLRHDSANLTNKYNNLNPTNEDVLLAREYQRVKEEINRLTTDLKNAETRKDNLEKALTLHDLKNKGENQIAFGTETLAVGNNSIAMGYKSITVGTDSVNIGARGQATGTSITQLGQDLVTNGNNNISIGNTNVINGENNIVFGRNNNIGALGDTNKSNGNIVLGSGIIVSKDITNSITLGDGSTPISNAISVGKVGTERQIKNVKDATDDQDAVTYKQLKDYVKQNKPVLEKDLNTTLYKTVDGVTTLNLGDKYEKITPVKLANKVEVAPNTDGTLSEVEINKIKDEIKKANPNIEESLITVDNKGNAVVAGTVFKSSENATVSNSNHLIDDTKTQDNPMYKVANTSTEGVAITNVKDAINEKDAVNLKTLNSKIADKLDKNLTT